MEFQVHEISDVFEEIYRMAKPWQNWIKCFLTGRWQKVYLVYDGLICITFSNFVEINKKKWHKNYLITMIENVYDF